REFLAGWVGDLYVEREEHGVGGDGWVYGGYGHGHAAGAFDGDGDVGDGVELSGCGVVPALVGVDVHADGCLDAVGGGWHVSGYHGVGVDRFECAVVGDELRDGRWWRVSVESLLACRVGHDAGFAGS